MKHKLSVVLLVLLAAAMQTAPLMSQTIGMVANNSSDSVTVFDADADSILGTISLPSGTVGDCSITADQALGFVTDFRSRIHVIDLAALTLASGTNPIGISNFGEDTSITPDQKFLVVSDGSAVQPISVVDIATRTQISTFSLGTDANSVDVCSDGSVLATSLRSDNVRRLTVDGAGALTDTGDVLSAPDPNNVFCAPGGTSGIVVTRGAGDMRSFTIPGLSSVDSRSLTGSFGISGQINPAGSLAYVRSNSSGSVDVFSYNSSTGTLGAAPLFSIPIPNTPTFFGMDQLALNPQGTKLYVARSGSVNVYDASTGSFLTTLSISGTNTGVCFANSAATTLDHFLAYDIKRKSMKSAKSAKSAKSEKSEKSGKSEKSEKSSKSEKSEKSAKSEKSSKSAKFEKFQVGLEDQFQSDTFTVEKRVALLTPVDKNGEGIANPETHLVAYRVKQFRPKGEPKPDKRPVIDITVTDQFFPDGLIVDIDDVNKADRLLVPASKDLSEVPDPLDPVNADHYLCYKVKPPEGTEFPKGGQVRLVDQFIEPGDKLFDIGKPRQLCNPASKEFPQGTVSEIQSPESHLMCYSVKRAEGEPKHERTVIYLNDQFGPTEEWETRKEKELCLPAEKTL